MSNTRSTDMIWYDKHIIFGMWFEIHTCFGMLIVKGVFLHLVHMHAHILTRQKWGGADAHAALRHDVSRYASAPPT